MCLNIYELLLQYYMKPNHLIRTTDKFSNFKKYHNTLSKIPYQIISYQIKPYQIIPLIIIPCYQILLNTVPHIKSINFPIDQVMLLYNFLIFPFILLVNNFILNLIGVIKKVVISYVSIFNYT